MSVNVLETSAVKYEVSFGPKNEADREKKSFNDQDQASDFFKAKQNAGMHVDVYEIETTVKRKKLS